MIPSKKSKAEKANKKGHFVLNTNKGNLIFYNPLSNFLIYGGAGSGKTKSIGKPLLREYIRNSWAGFIYDYKDLDLTKTAHHIVKKFEYQNKFYYISFTDMNRTYRTNPIKPSVVKDENLFLQLMDDLLSAFLSENSKKDEWFNGALGILKGVAIRFYNDYPEYCTIPHIVNYVCAAGAARITDFLEGSHQSRTLGSAFIDSKDSERTQASYLSTLTNYLAPLAFNKNIAYVLTGNDFDFNLIEPNKPKLVAVANSFQIENVISPIIALMLSVSSRRFTLENKIPFFYFLDEATTFKIPDFEKLPSVLREYKCSFTFITQSAAKIEKRYGRLDRSSIEANFGNQFYGLTKDIEALKTYTTVFGKEEKQKISSTRGSSTQSENRSKTYSKQKEERYDTNFFTKLNVGQFVGTTKEANKKDFNATFKMYNENEIELPITRIVLQSEISANYENLISEINSI